MKKVAITLILAILLLAVPASLFAVLSGDPIQTFECPFLLTSGGQGAGSKMLRLLINQSKKFTLGEDGDFWLEDETPERYAYIDSGRYTTLVIVISVTEKGLGASGINVGISLWSLILEPEVTILCECELLGLVDQKSEHL